AVVVDVAGADASPTAAPHTEALPWPGGAQARGSESAPAFEAWSWSPDGATIAGTAQGIVLYDVKGRTYRRLSDSGERPVWMPDGRRLLFTDDRTLYVVSAAQGRPHAIFSAAPSGILPGV